MVGVGNEPKAVDGAPNPGPLVDTLGFEGAAPNAKTDGGCDGWTGAGADPNVNGGAAPSLLLFATF